MDGVNFKYTVVCMSQVPPRLYFNVNVDTKRKDVFEILIYEVKGTWRISSKLQGLN